MVGLKGVAVSAIVGSTLVGWLGWPPAGPVPAAVDIVGPCSRATRQWVEKWRRAPSREATVAHVSVLCRADGGTDAATIVYSPSARGPRAVSWHPRTTFFGTLPLHATERLDIFGQNGELIEYAIVDRPAGRIEFYSVDSGWSSRGRIEALGAAGRRYDMHFVPIPPDADDGVPE